jgi:hypothetical protein
LFTDERSARRAYDAARARGYEPADINVIMSERTREALIAAGSDWELARKAGEKGKDPDSAADDVGGPLGGTLGTVAPALAAVGTVLLIPGIIAVGPIAIALTAAGAVGVTAGLIGALTKWGVPEKQLEEYEAAIRDGAIVIALEPRSTEDAEFLRRAWTQSGADSVRQ